MTTAEYPGCCTKCGFSYEQHRKGGAAEFCKGINDGIRDDLGLPPLKEMNEEHEAWKEMCYRIEVTVVTARDDSTVSMDDPRWRLAIAQIKYWGETLHRLRLANPQYDDKAYAEAKTEATA